MLDDIFGLSLLEGEAMQKSTILIVQARMGSIRLPGKSMMLINGKPLIMRVVDAIENYSLYDLCIATSESLDCDGLCNFLESEKVRVFRGSENNVLSRFADILSLKNYDNIIRITADDPCHSYRLIELGLLKFCQLDLDYFNSRSSVNNLPDGLGFEIFTNAMLKKVMLEYQLDKLSREHVTLRMRDGSIKLKSGSFSSSEVSEFTKGNQSLCIDTFDDYLKVNAAWDLIPGTKRPNTVQIIKNMEIKL